MTDPPKIRAEEVIGHAEAAALFFRTLLAEDVPPQHAAKMAADYVGALLIREHLSEGATDSYPRPWEEPPGD